MTDTELSYLVIDGEQTSKRQKHLKIALPGTLDYLDPEWQYHKGSGCPICGGKLTRQLPSPAIQCVPSEGCGTFYEYHEPIVSVVKRILGL